MAFQQLTRIIFVSILVMGCGRNAGPSQLFGTSSSEDHFKMTKELPDVTRRLLNEINTCWLHAGVKELEFDYFKTFHKPEPLSINYMLYAEFHDRFEQVVRGARIADADFEAGGEINEVRILADKFGVMREVDWSFGDVDWQSVSEALKPVSIKYRTNYNRYEREGKDPSRAIKEGRTEFFSTLRSLGIDVPQLIADMDQRHDKSPMTLSDSFTNENPADYVLYINRKDDSVAPTKADRFTNQDMYRTSWPSIAKAVKHQIDHGRSALVSVQLDNYIIDDQDGHWHVRDQSFKGEVFGHVMNIVGYHLNQDGTFNRVKIENSWGESDGRNGFIVISWPDLERLFESVSIERGFIVAEELDLRGTRITQ